MVTKVISVNSTGAQTCCGHLLCNSGHSNLGRVVTARFYEFLLHLASLGTVVPVFVVDRRHQLAERCGAEGCVGKSVIAQVKEAILTFDFVFLEVKYICTHFIYNC
jgi:hypothetical protein